ncbi:unnamed protein product [Ixodes persulcatus]
MAARFPPWSTWPGTLTAFKRRSWPSCSIGPRHRPKKLSSRPVPGELPGPEEVRLSAKPWMARSVPSVRWTPTPSGNGSAGDHSMVRTPGYVPGRLDRDYGRVKAV